MRTDQRLIEIPPSPAAARLADRFAPQLELCEQLLAAVWTGRPRPTPSMPEFSADILAILGRSLEMYDAVLALARTGRALPALLLNRALFEDMVAAFWLALPQNHETGPQRIRDQEDHIVLLTNDVIRKYPHRVLLSAEEHTDLEQSRKRFETTFGRYGEKAWFGDIYTAIDRIAPLWEQLGGQEETLRVYCAIVHRHINLHVHNTVSSIKRSFGRYDDPRKVDDLEIGLALRAAFFCLEGLALLVFRELGADSARLLELESQAHRVFTLDPKRLSQVGRNDPCPCRSGKKFKHCHGR
jgi:hypothetical protein